MITDATGATIWTWQGDPFGNSVPTSTLPKLDGLEIKDNILGITAQGYIYNQRFAGQTFDKETGLFYNYFRTYDPATARYVEADPIGLGGGWNRYAYVDGNPIGAVDPLGLETTIDAGIRRAALKGDVEELKTLIEIANPQQTSLIQKLLTPARDLIKGSTKRSASYASELEEKTYVEICKLARGNSELANKASKMKKLIREQERLLAKY